MVLPFFCWVIQHIPVATMTHSLFAELLKHYRSHWNLAFPAHGLLITAWLAVVCSQLCVIAGKNKKNS
jgi:hypothetical protein